MLFEDQEKRNFVNTIVHPLVSEERRNKIRAIEETRIYDFFIYESALLVESGIYKEFEKIIVVYASPDVQIARAAGPGQAVPRRSGKTHPIPVPAEGKTESGQLHDRQQRHVAKTPGPTPWKSFTC